MPAGHLSTELAEASNNKHKTIVEKKPPDNSYPETMNNDGDGPEHINAAQAALYKIKYAYRLFERITRHYGLHKSKQPSQYTR